MGAQKNFIIVSDQRIIPIPEALEQKIVKMSKKIQRYLYCFEKKIFGLSSNLAKKTLVLDRTQI